MKKIHILCLKIYLINSIAKVRAVIVLDVSRGKKDLAEIMWAKLLKVNEWIAGSELHAGSQAVL